MLSAQSLFKKTPYRRFAGKFTRSSDCLENFSWNREHFVQKLFAVSKSLLYSKLRCFEMCTLWAGFAVGQRNWRRAKYHGSSRLRLARVC
jgi:hypothetical protein